MEDVKGALFDLLLAVAYWETVEDTRKDACVAGDKRAGGQRLNLANDAQKGAILRA